MMKKNSKRRLDYNWFNNISFLIRVYTFLHFKKSLDPINYIFMQNFLLKNQ